MMDIGSSVFTCGQAYVALSRVTSLGGLHLINVNFSSIKAQETAIAEYNRLRSIYRPDLSTLEVTEPQRRNKRDRDREWVLSKAVAEVQEIMRSPKKKKEIHLQKINEIPPKTLNVKKCQVSRCSLSIVKSFEIS
ncbi:hypothetical protein B5X24_HaOG204355 [Helicoverpa armigera]|uniref:Uncharacterized protein n=1 Tax=Helicoverpa armigera TaxID=29058 RepID=A0A2W1BNM8_HELAM|nr:hypothetical protein B5X24_HaOG204355 [Helicoverpa armigera]